MRWSFSEPCNLVKYVAQVDKSPCSSPRAQCYKEKKIWMFAVKNEISHHRTAYKISINNFISAVGGSLGLFLGFSILSTTFEVLNWLVGNGGLSFGGSKISTYMEKSP